MKDSEFVEVSQREFGVRLGDVAGAVEVVAVVVASQQFERVQIVWESSLDEEWLFQGDG